MLFLTIISNKIIIYAVCLYLQICIGSDICLNLSLFLCRYVQYMNKMFIFLQASIFYMASANYENKNSFNYKSFISKDEIIQVFAEFCINSVFLL